MCLSDSTRKERRVNFRKYTGYRLSLARHTWPNRWMTREFQRTKVAPGATGKGEMQITKF